MLDLSSSNIKAAHVHEHEHDNVHVNLHEHGYIALLKGAIHVIVHVLVDVIVDVDVDVLVLVDVGGLLDARRIRKSRWTGV